jgi:hypothetical protein
MENRARFGPLGDLCPYIERRWGARSNGQLPDLPVPKALQQVFQDWARGKVNFIAQTS